MKTEHKNIVRQLLRTLIVIAGTFVMAVGSMVFLAPYDIVPGGFTGFAILLNKTLIPVITPGVISLILNVPLFIFAFRIRGKGFVLNSLVGTVAYSVFIDLIPLINFDPALLTDNALLATVYGGMLLGLGYGVIIRAGGSTGGSDTLASLVTAKRPNVSFGTMLLIIDAVVVVFSGVAFSIKGGGIEYGVPPALYAFLVIILSSLISDFIIEGKQSSRAYFIFCTDPDTMAATVLEKLGRGVTALSAKGMYTKRDKQVLFCVVLRSESAELKRIVASLDPTAFTVSANTSEVFGEGFERHAIKEPKLKEDKRDKESE